LLNHLLMSVLVAATEPRPCTITANEPWRMNVNRQRCYSSCSQRCIVRV